MGSKTNNNVKIETMISNDKLFNVSVNPKMASNTFNTFFINVGMKFGKNLNNITLNDNQNTFNNISFDKLI